MDRAEEITHEIERKLCSFCCDRLFDQPKATPCTDCIAPGWFNDAERAAVATIIRAAICSSLGKSEKLET